MSATAELVAEHGYRDTTIEMIVRNAKVGYATFYRNYPDKEKCFLALLEVATERTARLVKAAYDAEDGPWTDKVAAALDVLLGEAVAHPAAARAFLVEALTAGPEAVERHETALQRFAPLLRPGRELCSRDVELPETLENTLVGGVFWLVNLRLLAGEASEIHALLPEVLEFVFRSYVGEDEAAREARELAAAHVG